MGQPFSFIEGAYSLWNGRNGEWVDTLALDEASDSSRIWFYLGHVINNLQLQQSISPTTKALPNQAVFATVDNHIMCYIVRILVNHLQFLQDTRSKVDILVKKPTRNAGCLS
jgi:hypothetical protein